MTTAVDLVGRSTDRGSALRIGRGWLAVVAGGCLAAATLVLTRRARAVGQAAGRYRTLVHSAGDLIAVLAADLRLDYVSPAAADVLGAPAATLTGLPFARLVHPDDEAGLFALVQTAHADPGTAHRAVLRLRHTDGRWRFGDVAVRSLLGDPVLDGLVVTVRDVTERCELEAQLAERALRDALTGLANRALFLQHVDAALARARRDRRLVTVVCLDLDDFTVVNESLGHAAGDRVLVAIAERLRRVARGGDVVARLGGDAFALLLETESEAEADLVVGRLFEELRAVVALGERDVLVRATAGVESTRPGGAAGASGEEFAEDLLRDAESATTVAKRRTRGGWLRFSPEMHTDAMRRLVLAAELRAGLERGEFSVRYQPIVDMASGSVTGVEALVRWEHPTRGSVGPREFIPYAEESGFIRSLGHWVLEEACRQAAEWARLLPEEPLGVSVNVSAGQLLAGGFDAEVRDVLARTGLAPHLLTLEITESALLGDLDRIRVDLARLQALGVTIALDDFGTGYSSLAYLRRLPVDIFKIDRSFVTDVERGEEEAAVVRAVLRLARIFGFRTVAEGIEREEQRRTLAALGCDLGQGYLISRPARPADVLARARAERRSGGLAGVAAGGEVG
ncbi:MAG TPA: EAL domain-containing protein [Mycobacteriales bacterium]|nr:EAL domain-containing protein [Mycobacteriales bacterium]